MWGGCAYFQTAGDKVLHGEKSSLRFVELLKDFQRVLADGLVIVLAIGHVAEQRVDGAEDEVKVLHGRASERA